MSRKREICRGEEMLKIREQKTREDKRRQGKRRQDKRRDEMSVYN